MARSRRRRLLALGLTALSVAALLGAVLVKWWMAPRLIKIPETGTSTTISEGDGQALDISTGQLMPIRAQATLTVVALPKESTSHVTVVSAITCIRVLGPGGAAPGKQGCVPTDDPNYLTMTTEQIAMDRKNAESVKDDGRYGTNLNSDKAIPHVGLTYTFPIGTKKHDYTLFDGTAGKAYPVHYLGTEKLRGLTVYRFEQSVQAPIKIRDVLPGTYTNTHTVWVEPVTGSIVRDRQVVAETLDSGQLALGGTLDFTPATVAKAVHDAKSMKDQIGLLRFWLPLGLLLLGVLLVPVIVLVARSVRVGGAPVPEQPADLEPRERAGPAEVAQPTARQDLT
ncbi:MAG TPA: DUF3068 domain-containing protein [Jatrophihabitantaceae bacterium]